MSSSGQKAPIRIRRSQSNLNSQPSTSTSSSSSNDPSLPATQLRPHLTHNDSSSSAHSNANRNWLGLGRSRSHSTSNQNQQHILPTHSHNSNAQVDWVRNHLNQDQRLDAEVQLAEEAYENEQREREDGLGGPLTRSASGGRTRSNARSGVVERLAMDDRIARESKGKEREKLLGAKLQGGIAIQRTISTGFLDRSDSMPSSRTNNSNLATGSSSRGTASRVRAHSRATDGHLSNLGCVVEGQSLASLPKSQSSSAQPDDYFSQDAEHGSPKPRIRINDGRESPTQSISTSPGGAPVATPGADPSKGTKNQSGWFGNALRKTMSSTNVFTLSRKPSEGSIAKVGEEGTENERTIQRQREESEREREEREQHHAEEVVDYLDVIDPEVAALGHLSNIQSSIFMPNIFSGYFDRRPSHSLPPMAPSNSVKKAREKTSSEAKNNASGVGSWGRNSRRSDRESEEGGDGEGEGIELPNRVTARRGSKPSLLSRVSSAVSFKTSNTQLQTEGTIGGDKARDEQTYADDDEDDDEDEDEDRNLTKEERLEKRRQELENMKHIPHWKDLDDEERNELDEHVRALLTKKAKFRRGLKGFWAFFKTPIGFIMTLYGFLITFWGTAIVLFIFKWIDVGSRRRYWIEICDQILCALFVAVGLGFAPFRAVDTYRMIHIAHFHHLTWKRREKLQLPELIDPNDLPRPVNEGMNQVIQEENQDHYDAEERIRKRLELRKLGRSQSFREVEEKMKHREKHQTHPNGSKEDHQSTDSDITFRRSSINDSRSDGITPASNDSQFSDPLNTMSSRNSSEIRSSSTVSRNNVGLDSDSDEDGAANDASNLNLKKRRKKGKKGKHQNLIVPPLAREDAIKAAEADRIKREENERKAKERAEAKEAKKKAKTEAKLRKGQSGTSSNESETDEDAEEELQEKLRPPIKRHTSLQSELVKDKEDVVVLTPEEQSILQHHQRKFHASHSFYRFHETATHRAFPLDLMIVIVCLLDCHSLIQMALGSCTWSIYYLDRPTALTATLISCSLSCNAVAGILIYVGGRRTKKREEVERRLKVALETEAWKRMERRRERELQQKERMLEEGVELDARVGSKKESVSKKKSKKESNQNLVRNKGSSPQVKKIEEQPRENPWKTS